MLLEHSCIMHCRSFLEMGWDNERNFTWRQPPTRSLFCLILKYYTTCIVYTIHRGLSGYLPILTSGLELLQPQEALVINFRISDKPKKKLTIKMSWSVAQQLRLSTEKDILDKEMNSVTWYNQTSAGNARVEWKVSTNNGRSYTLRIYIPTNFPNECPVVVVSCSPFGTILKTKGGSLMNKPSRPNHTYAAYDGFTRICHFKDSLWSNDNTLYMVFMKGRLWLEAYEFHLQNGANLDAYLPHMDWANKLVVQSFFLSQF